MKIRFGLILKKLVLLFFVFSVVCRWVSFEGRSFYILGCLLFLIPITMKLRRLSQYKNVWVGGIFLIIIVFSTFFNSGISDRTTRAIEAIFMYLAYIVGILYANEGDKLERNLTAIRDIGVLCSIMGLVEAIIKYNFLAYNYCVVNGVEERYYWQFANNNYRIATVFLHPIIYGTILLLCFWVTVYKKDNFKKKVIYILLITSNIILTMSRSIWGGFFASVFVYLLLIFVNKGRNFLKIKRRNFFTAAIVFILVVILLISPFGRMIFIKLISRLTDITSDNSYLQRKGTSIYFFRTIFSINSVPYWFIGHGHRGINVIMKNLTIISSNFYTTDNQYISMMYNYGLIFSGVVGITAINSFRKLRKSSEFKKSVIIALIAIMVSMYFFEIFNYTSLNWLFWMLFGYVITNPYKASLKEREKYETFSCNS